MDIKSNFHFTDILIAVIVWSPYHFYSWYVCVRAGSNTLMICTCQELHGMWIFYFKMCVPLYSI